MDWLNKLSSPGDYLQELYLTYCYRNRHDTYFCFAERKVEISYHDIGKLPELAKSIEEKADQAPSSQEINEKYFVVVATLPDGGSYDTGRQNFVDDFLTR